MLLYQNLTPIVKSSISLSHIKTRRTILQKQLYAIIINNITSDTRTKECRGISVSTPMNKPTRYTGVFREIAINNLSSNSVLLFSTETQNHNKKYRRRRQRQYDSYHPFSTNSSSDGEGSNNAASKHDRKEVEEDSPAMSSSEGATSKSKDPDTKSTTSSTNTQQQFQWQNKTYQYTPSSSSDLADIADLDSYRHIARKQAEAAKKSRDITTANVRRALYGNVVICAAKLGAWMSCGSSAMLAEFIHSLVDCGNQGLLLIGLRDSALLADRRHPYGYGKSIYFWALVSALGTFWLGAGVAMRHSIEELLYPSVSDISWQVWGVLGMSLTIDGWVLVQTVKGINATRTPGSSFWDHVWKIRDPATLAILLEDGAACLGIVICSTGIALTHFTNMPVFDGLAGVAVSGLLAGMGLILVRLNRRFLLGQAVDPETTAGIEKILLRRRSIDTVHSVQSQWAGPDTFSYKASIDFDGTYLAAKLIPRYQNEFLKLTQVSNEQAVKDMISQDLPLLLSWYAEDVVRTVEKEVRVIEAEIRHAYPGATYIELEPDSKFSNRYAVDDSMEARLKLIEMEALTKYLKSLYIDQLSTTSASIKKEDDIIDDNKKE